MCEFLSKSKINWSVWTDWWEARRDGKPYNFEMEREIVLIPDEAWENGPAHINSLIAHIRARYARIAESQDRALRAVLDTDVAIVAIAEFDYNRIDHVMRMLPFADELARIDTPSCVSLLSELRDAAQDLSDDIQKSQAPLPLKRTIKRYAEEAARDPDAVRPGRLHDLARLLRKARANEDIMGAMPELADEALRQFVDRHLELMRSILANTMARMERTENISFAMEGSAENVAEGLARGADAIRNAIWKAVPRASDEAAAIMKDISEEILEIAQERDTAATPEKRAARQAELDEKAKIGGSTMIRYSLRAVQATAGSVNLAAAGKTLWPETFDVALKMVVEQFVGFKLPWS